MTTRITHATEATQATQATEAPPSLQACQTVRPTFVSGISRAVAALASVVVSVTLIGGVVHGFGVQADAASELAQAAQPTTRA